MAVQTWEEILAAAQLSADESKLLDKIVQRVPEFKDGRLRQDDYSRKSQDLQKKQKDYDDAIALKERMNAWYEERKPAWDQLVEAGAIDEESKPLWPAEKARLAKELEDAKKAAVAGADMDPAELTRRVEEIVKANGGVTQAEMKALVASEAARMANETMDVKYKGWESDFNTKTIPFVGGWSANNSLAAMDYEKATGEEFTEDVQKALFAVMTKEGMEGTPRKAMKIMLEPALKKKADAEEVKRLGREEAERILRERGELVDGEPYIPVPDKQNQPRGSLQRLLEDSKDEGDVESQAMAAGRKAAQELRAAGKY